MNDNDAPSHNNDVDPWVQSQLSAYHIVWLEKQRQAVDPTEILKFAIAEWVTRHPADWFGHTNVGIAMRSALNEFIERHSEEFISTD